MGDKKLLIQKAFYKCWQLTLSGLNFKIFLQFHEFIKIESKLTFEVESSVTSNSLGLEK
jgi:hypothetical protein